MRTAAAVLVLSLAACGPQDATLSDFADDETGESLGALGVMRINECKAGTGGYIELVNVSSATVDLAQSAGNCWLVDDQTGGAAHAMLSDANVRHVSGSTRCAAASRPENCALVGPGERVWISYAGLNASRADQCRLLQSKFTGGACEQFIEEQVSPTLGTGCYGRLPDSTGSWQSAAISCTAEGAKNDGAVPSSPVLINEFKAGTSGFIELFNASMTQSVDLTGWQVDDVIGGASAKTISAGTVLGPRGRMLVPFGGINVSSSDEVRLLAPGGAVLDARSNGYAGKSLSGLCIGRSPDGAAWSALPVPCSPGTPNPASRCPGGTYAGVTFTAAEECRAIDFLNNAAFSEISAVMGANIPYDCAPDGTCGLDRKSAWQRLDQLTGFAKAAECADTSLAGLKTASANFTASSPRRDTVASVWANRTALKNRYVTLERAVVTETIPNQPVEQNCAVVRDAANDSNWITVCEYVNPFCDCRGSVNWAARLGREQFIRGQLQYLSYVQGGRWVIMQGHTAGAAGSGTTCGAGSWLFSR